MKYDLLLFDADDTLLDFKKSEQVSFEMMFKKNGIDVEIKLLHERYKIINDRLWHDHARGLISKDFLKVERFRLLIDEHGLAADPHQLCNDYLELLPTQVFLVSGALELLQSIHGKVPLVIVTNGIGPVQHLRLKNSGLAPFIKSMIVSEECGHSKPDRRIFDYTFHQLQTSHLDQKVLMIGDKLETDIMGAHNSEIDSCWFNPEKEKNLSEIRPTYEINSLLQLLDIL